MAVADIIDELAGVEDNVRVKEPAPAARG